MHPPVPHFPPEHKFPLLERILCQPHRESFTPWAAAVGITNDFFTYQNRCVRHTFSIGDSSPQSARWSILKGGNDYVPQNRQGVHGCSVSSSPHCRAQSCWDREMVPPLLKGSGCESYVLAGNRAFIRMCPTSDGISPGARSGFPCTSCCPVVTWRGQAAKEEVILAGRTDSVPLRSCGTGAGLCSCGG